VIEGSTAKETSAKPYVTAAQIRAVSEHLERRGDHGAKVESIPELSMLRTRYALPSPAPLVSLIVPTFNQYKLLSQCVDGILNGTSYKNIELIIVDNRSNDPETLEYLRELPSKDSRVKVIRDDGAFNFARINNDAVKHATGSVLGFVNNDIQIIRPDWLDEMVSNLARKDIGAVGARLLFPNGTVQHAGVITGIGGVAGHQFKTFSVGSLGYFCRAVLPQNLSAVTAACMLVHTDLFNKVGGFDQERLAVAFNDIDLCLKIREAGYLIVYTPYAELLHHESVSRGYEDSPEKKARFAREFKAMQERWGEKLVTDPYYNPNFTLEGVGYDLGPAPRRFGRAIS
jgi:GT2 family glycosyltransferase